MSSTDPFAREDEHWEAVEAYRPSVSPHRRLAAGQAALPGEERRLMFLSMDNEVCFVWLADALQQLRQERRTKVLGYLEAVLEEVVFEAKMTAG